MELSLSRTFAPGSENVMELSLPGAKVMWNFRSRERKRRGTFVPGSEKVVELSLSMRNC